MTSLAETWYTAFMQALQRHEASRPLKEAASAGRLGDWTKSLTGVVVDVCRQMGWQTAAKWHQADVLPITRSEYLALDAMAFKLVRSGVPNLLGERPRTSSGVRKEDSYSIKVAQDVSSPRWPFPVAVFELENSRQDAKVAYSLWKVLCVRARLRVVFCYRRDVTVGSALVRHLEGAVVGSLSIEERVNLVGETLLIVGSRAEESTFPYGFFKDWVLDKNTGRFARG